MQDMQTVCDFMKKAGVYYLATYDDKAGQARVRPFGTFNIFEDRAYIQTGRKKDVARQILANPKVEFSAMNDGDKWIRLEATLVEDDRKEAQQAMLDAYPSLKGMYAAGDGNTMVLYLTNATATISSFKGESETYHF